MTTAVPPVSVGLCSACWTSVRLSVLSQEAAVRALQVLTADRRRLLSRLCEIEADRSTALTAFEEAKRNWQLELQRVDK